MPHTNPSAKRLRIAQIAPLWFPVPPTKYGGTERVIAFLTNELVRQGHEVTLFAAPGSATLAKQIHVHDKSLYDAGVDWSNPTWNLYNLSRALEMAKEGKFDVIHSHVDSLGVLLQGISPVPVLHTMHGNLIAQDPLSPDQDRYQIFEREAHRTNIVFISQMNRRVSGIAFPKSDVIYNPIDIHNFAFESTPDDYFVWCARFAKEKGAENAIAIAERLGLRLLLAGQIQPQHREYFEQKIKPRLNDKIQYVGELSHRELPAFYGKAKAMLFPIEWEEPFGLVVAEAMSCGTPVIAYRRGSMSEIIKDGVSGFVVDSNLNALEHAIGQLHKINRSAVRAHTLSMFHPQLIAEQYEAKYRELIGEGSGDPVKNTREKLRQLV